VERVGAVTMTKKIIIILMVKMVGDNASLPHQVTSTLVAPLAGRTRRGPIGEFKRFPDF